MFDVHDFVLMYDKYGDSTERYKNDFNWYKKKVLLPVWNDYTAFYNSVPVEYYDNVRYHGLIMALRFHKSIYYYPKII